MRAVIEREITIGTATLFLGDAYAIRPTLGWMDAEVMDPPYLFSAGGGGAFRKARVAGDQIVSERLDQGFDHSIIDPSRSGAVVVFCHNDQVPDLVGDVVEDDREFGAVLAADMLSCLRPKFHRAALLAWIKPNPSPMRNRHYLADVEHYIHAWNKGWHPVGEHHDMHRWITAQPMPSKVWGHPTSKPLAVMDKIVRNVAGKTVCDPFMGSGSTGVSAVLAGKRFYGIERNPRHFATASERIAAAVHAMAAEDLEPAA